MEFLDVAKTAGLAGIGVFTFLILFRRIKLPEASRNQLTLYMVLSFITAIICIYRSTQQIDVQGLAIKDNITEDINLDPNINQFAHHSNFLSHQAQGYLKDQADWFLGVNRRYPPYYSQTNPKSLKVSSDFSWEKVFKNAPILNP